MRPFLPACLLALAAPFCAPAHGVAQDLAQNFPQDPNGAIAVSFAPDTTNATPKAPKNPVSLDLSAIDKTVNPCDDFYTYSCGNWRKLNPLTAQYSRYGRFNELGERNNYLLYTDLQKAAEAPKTPLQTKYGNFFASCMDVEAVDKLGAAPIQPELRTIDTLKSTKDLATLNVALTKQFGGSELLGVGVTQDQKDSTQQILSTGQGGLTLPDRDYYLNSAPRFAKLRDAYVANLKATFVLLGDTPDVAATEAAAVMRDRNRARPGFHGSRRNA